MKCQPFCVLYTSQRRFEQAQGHDGQRCLRRAMAGWHQVRVAQLALFNKGNS